MGLVGLIAYLTPTLAGAVALIYSITLGYDDQVIEGKNEMPQLMKFLIKGAVWEISSRSG
jgi:hypothetical protein